MRVYPRPLARLIEELEKLPGIGPKSAQRLALHLLHASMEDTTALAEAIREVKEKIGTCPRCFNYAEGDLCGLCAEAGREEDPMDGIGPDSLRIAELVERAREVGFREVILATNPTVEGDATAMYIAGLLKPLGVKVTRIALGLPVGGDLDYADAVTISRSVEGRQEM